MRGSHDYCMLHFIHMLLSHYAKPSLDRHLSIGGYKHCAMGSDTIHRPQHVSSHFLVMMGFRNELHMCLYLAVDFLHVTL